VGVYISVIMAVYNGEEFLREAIESILKQTFTDWELIIVNDGSQDSSLSILNEYQEKDKRIIIIDQENMGLTKSLNVAISHSKGRYIARQDADDLSEVHRFSNFKKFVEDNGDIEFYSTPVYVFTNDIKEKVVIPWWFRRNRFSEKMLYYSNSLVHGALIVDGDLLRKVKYNENFRYSQDFELYHRLFKLGYHLNYDPANISYSLRVHDASISGQKKDGQLECYKQVFKDNGLIYYPVTLFNRIRFKLWDIFNGLVKSS